MTFYKAWVKALRQEREAIDLRLAKEAPCYGCATAPLYYCVQCEVRDINHKEKGACEHTSG